MRVDAGFSPAGMNQLLAYMGTNVPGAAQQAFTQNILSAAKALASRNEQRLQLHQIFGPDTAYVPCPDRQQSVTVGITWVVTAVNGQGTNAHAHVQVVGLDF